MLVIFCGDSEEHAGAIELWHNDAQAGKDMRLDDGYYGNTADVFEFISRRTTFRKGSGLPGLAWSSGLPVFIEDLGKGGRFLRADSAIKVGINRGFAIPCSVPCDDTFVMAFLSALATPKEAGPVGAAAREAGLQAVVALPVLNAGRVAAVMAWYF